MPVLPVSGSDSGLLLSMKIARAEGQPAAPVGPSLHQGAELGFACSPGRSRDTTDRPGRVQVIRHDRLDADTSARKGHGRLSRPIRGDDDERAGLRFAKWTQTLGSVNCPALCGGFILAERETMGSSWSSSASAVPLP